MLTKRQKEVLNTIETFIKNNGYSPTYRDIAQMLSMKHVSITTLYSPIIK